MPEPAVTPKSCSCGDDHKANVWVCVKWKEAKAALTKQAPKRDKRTPLQAALPPRKLSGLPPCRAEEPGSGVQPGCPWGRVVKATSTLSPNRNPKPVTEASKQAEVTTTRKKAKSKKLQSKPTAAPKPVTEKKKRNKQTRLSKPWLKTLINLNC
jgi:hypothetical protein